MSHDVGRGRQSARVRQRQASRHRRRTRNADDELDEFDDEDLEDAVDTDDDHLIELVRLLLHTSCTTFKSSSCTTLDPRIEMNVESFYVPDAFARTASICRRLIF